MPARTRRPNHNDKSREKIKSSQLINALINHALGKNDMKTSQVRAAEILLRKTLPDLSNTELTGADGADLIPTSIKIVHE